MPPTQRVAAAWSVKCGWNKAQAESPTPLSRLGVSRSVLGARLSAPISTSGCTPRSHRARRGLVLAW